MLHTMRANITITPPEHFLLKILNIELLEREMTLTIPFETSFGRMTTIKKIFPKIEFISKDSKKIIGIGECPTLPAPWYDGESYETVKAVLDKFIVPSLTKEKNSFTNVNQFIKTYSWIVGHNIAKVGVEGAYWDAVGKYLRKPVYELWGGKRKTVETGTSVGLEKTDEEILKKIDMGVKQKVKRIKIKIKPGRDIELMEKVRKKYPNLPIQVDGNAAYNIQDSEHQKLLQQLDKFNLIMIEQPGPNDDRYFHSILSKRLKTPICLDESIMHERHAIEAIDIWGNNKILDRLIINIKPPRVGGFWEGVKIAKVCENAGVQTWCGGMLESALGKIANVHFSSLQEVTLPGDHVSQMPYYKQDIANPLESVNGEILVPTNPGWGIEKLEI